MPEDRSFDEAYYEALANKWLDGTITNEEKRLLEEWYSSAQDSPVHIPASFAADEHAHGQRMLAAIRDKIAGHAPPAKVRRLPIRWAAAAVVLIMAAAAAFLLMPRRGIKETDVTKEAVIQPGGSKAILTLANGSTIELDSLGNREILQNGVAIHQQGGQLQYVQDGEPQPLAYNTLETPRGAQFRITLPDGTMAWLNAASSITYPTAFTGNERKVSVTGEVYFEVAKNAVMPFRVTAGEMNVEVLGTHFNVNAYTEEGDVRTTLLEGRVKVTNKDGGRLLTPGQQAHVAPSGTIKVVNADAEQVLAWKNGLFNFDGADLQTVVRQLERWYDIEVKFEGAVPEKKFKGDLPRDLSFAQIVKILGKMNLQCRVEQRTVTIYP